MTLIARVQNGRLVIDEPTTLPEGQVVRLEVIRDDWANEQTWSPAMCDALEGALAQGSADAAAGKTVDARAFLATLPDRG